MAAKAAGIVVVRSRLDDMAVRDMLIEADPIVDQRLKGWNPLTDDGDALRLAVKLDFRLDIDRDRAWAAVIAPPSLFIDVVVQMDDCGNPYAAMRRVIVRAAAEMGEKL